MAIVEGCLQLFGQDKRGAVVYPQNLDLDDSNRYRGLLLQGLYRRDVQTYMDCGYNVTRDSAPAHLCLQSEASSEKEEVVTERIILKTKKYALFLQDTATVQKIDAFYCTVIKFRKSVRGVQ